MTTIAIMQPYFLPYAGYFCLCAASDVFVFLDDVQFPRRGWVHRNRLRNEEHELSWLTLPLVSSARDSTMITDLRFRPDAKADMDRQIRRFPLFSAPNSAARDLRDIVVSPTGVVNDYLQTLVRRTCDQLGFEGEWSCSSKLDIDSELRGWQKLVAIADCFGARTYVNASGGANLYSAEDFRRHGLELKVLSPYRGATDSIIQRIHAEGAGAVRREVLRNIEFIH